MKDGSVPPLSRFDVRTLKRGDIADLGLMAIWLAAAVGYFAPWIVRRPISAALAWNAYDLFDILRLLPEIERGTLTVNLQTLQLPLLGLAVLLPVLAARWPLLPRIGTALVAFGLAALTLPPYPEILDAWRTPGWRVPFWWGIGGMLFALSAVWIAPRLEKVRFGWVVAIVEVAVLPAIVTMKRLLPALSTLHAAPVRMGWGFWLCLIGLGLIGTIAAIRTLEEG